VGTLIYINLRIIYLVLTRYLAGIFVWISILLYFVLLCVLTAYINVRDKKVIFAILK